MHRLTIVLVTVALSSCGDDSSMSETEPGTSMGSDGATAGSSGGPPTTTTTTTDPSDTSADTTGPPGTSTTDMPTTDPPADSSGDSGEPLEGDVLQNDSWTPADGLTWQSWPGVNDCWASVYSADPGQYPFEVVGAIAAIGNGAGVYAFEIGIWEVSNQGQPTTELGSMVVDIDGGTSNLTEIDLTGLGVPAITMNDDFALVMCHTEHMGAPSIAVDADGDVDASRNWVFQQAMGDWVQAPDFFGINGDFILRAVIMPM